MNVSEGARHKARKIILERLVAEREPDEMWLRDSEDVAFHGPRRYALVERNYRTEADWITTHDTPEDAAYYHVTQEYAADWDAEILVDLDTGLRYTPTVSIEFNLAPEETT